MKLLVICIILINVKKVYRLCRFLLILIISKMDCMFEAYLGHDSSIEPDDIPKTNDPVWILGKKFNAIQGLCFCLFCFHMCKLRLFLCFFFNYLQKLI